MNEHFFFPHLVLIQKIARRRKVQTFLIGGALRDVLLNREIIDLDFAVERNAVSFARFFSKEIKGAFVFLDQDHGCARVVKKNRGQIYTFDFADFRAESFKNDLLCRDFTINTLAIDMADWNGKNLIDQKIDLLSGQKDLQAGVIRMVSAEAFEQDPLRLMRAFALKAMLGFSIEKNTLSQIKKDHRLIRDVSAERIREELFKILESARAGTVLKDMDRIGLLEQVIPQVRIMFGVEQGTYHHLDVWRHALETVAQVEELIKNDCGDEKMIAYLNERLAGNRSRKALLKLACLLHDVGKPETRKREGERIRFHGHEHAGRMISQAVAKQLKLSTRERYVLGDMIQLHLRPGYLSNFKRPSPKAVFRYFRDTREEAVSIALLARADQHATCGPMTTAEEAQHHDAICLNLINRYFEMQAQTPLIPLINGDDLIQILKLQPSPIFSRILKEVDEAQATGKITAKDEALIMARGLAEAEKSSRAKGAA